MLYSQYEYLRNTPFQERLHNLNLDKAKLKALVPKLKNKMEEYRKMDKLIGNSQQIAELERKACQILITDADAKKDDISFAFVTGLVMQPEFAKQAKMEREAKAAAQN
ncbi:MAG: hypothetical protein D6772_11730 [Bacteroidetes bacterium]|nr:MAG: hypothetical protein D6772_11730 [Bacteroidota bacterium]